ncbi:MAG: hypothetical protein IJ781_03925, partial [Atopobiaceae bacterium]|nr:hypothetical protein [Atopobiaceae bacterium]
TWPSTHRPWASPTARRATWSRASRSWARSAARLWARKPQRWQGIPAQVLGVLTALDLLLDYPCTAGNVGSLILLVFSAADSLGLVDRDAQRS